MGCHCLSTCCACKHRVSCRIRVSAWRVQPAIFRRSYARASVQKNIEAHAYSSASIQNAGPESWVDIFPSHFVHVLGSARLLPLFGKISLPLGFSSCWKECSKGFQARRMETSHQATGERAKPCADDVAGADSHGKVIPLDEPPL